MYSGSGEKLHHCPSSNSLADSYLLLGVASFQAFSHFTFERSGHKLIVVDIQGVEDLYTDPQIHTAGGKEYGDGNLGPKGMALFFHSHVCNRICISLSLTPFDMAPSELDTLRNFISEQVSGRSSVWLRAMSV